MVAFTLTDRTCIVGMTEPHFGVRCAIARGLSLQRCVPGHFIITATYVTQP